MSFARRYIDVNEYLFGEVQGVLPIAEAPTSLDQVLMHVLQGCIIDLQLSALGSLPSLETSHCGWFGRCVVYR